MKEFDLDRTMDLFVGGTMTELWSQDLKSTPSFTFDRQSHDKAISDQFDTTMEQPQTRNLVPLAKYNRLAMKGCSLADFPFMVPSQYHDRTKKSLFRKCSQNILGAALQHFERITSSEDSLE